MTGGAIAFLARHALFAAAGSVLLLVSLAAAAQESRPATKPSARETAPAYQPGMLDRGAQSGDLRAQGGDLAAKVLQFGHATR